MTFSSLMLCDDVAAIKILCKALDETRMQREICAEQPQAFDLLHKRKFEAVIIDCDGIEDGADFMRCVRKAPLNKFAILFAMINGKTSVAQAFQDGANFVLDKPLNTELTMRSMRAALGFMIREQRRFYRHPVNVLVHIAGEQGREVSLTTRNVSEGGLGIEGVKALTPHESVSL